MVSDGLSLVRFVFKFYFMCVCVYLSVCMCTICVQVLMDPRRGLRSLKTEVRDGCEPSEVGAGTELGSSPKTMYWLVF